jgi:HEAT repeat protein
MARVAKADPDAVEPALNDLIELLEGDDVEIRLNACSAISRKNAESALGVLKERSANDPEKEMRQAAEQAIEEISEHTQ